METQVALSPPGWAMLGLLVLCAVALLGLVVTLPSIRGFFGKLLRLGTADTHAPDARHQARA